MTFTLLYITHSNELEAQRIVHHLLSDRLIACANIFPIQSAYWWQEAIQQDAEWVSILKTSRQRAAAAAAEAERIHPYDTPCIIQLEVQANAAYVQWIEDMVSDKR
ncbi:MAG TPA: divalent-cation tolerance protein CutA [Saprospiraceae bacterium]|nr:divalent-cation tolerance protein CutA [Saprospiraceae bacterium]HMP12468.1 divalent-cation tolerance protein CutA [Saprospiraceae bacterium]